LAVQFSEFDITTNRSVIEIEDILQILS